MHELDHIWLSVSATTRAPRANEIEGVHYFFKTEEAFDQLIAEDGLLEWAEYAGNKYGTPRQSVEEHLAAGYHVLLEIECQGAFQVKERMPEAHLVFIEPPSLEELEHRLVNRGTDSPEAIARRLETAKQELELADEYDFRLVNDNLDLAAAELIQYVRSTAEREKE